MTGSGGFSMDPITLVPFPSVMLFMQLEKPGRNLQSIFMLPLRREEIVSRYGAALLLVLLKEWLMFAVALFVVDWMPVPGKVHGVPAMMPFLLSLLAQVPAFGVLTLIIGRTRVAVIALIIVSMVVVPLNFAGMQWLLLVVSIIGPALIVFSYRHWCRAEIN